MEKYIIEIMEKTRLEFYRKVFINMRENGGSLSATDVVSLEVINALEEPTISEFARFTGISQSNATYKITSLIKKGYLEKHVCMDDKREFVLKLTDRYQSYYDMFERSVTTISKKIASQLPEKEFTALEGVLKKLSSELSEGNYLPFA